MLRRGESSMAKGAIRCAVLCCAVYSMVCVRCAVLLCAVLIVCVCVRCAVLCVYAIFYSCHTVLRCVVGYI